MRTPFIIAATLALAGCGSPDNLGRVQGDMAIADARLAVAGMLRDPGSARFQDVRIVESGMVCGMVNARNGFGGYAGPTGFMFDPATGETTLADRRDGNVALAYQTPAFDAHGCSIGPDHEMLRLAHADMEAMDRAAGRD